MALTLRTDNNEFTFNDAATSLQKAFEIKSTNHYTGCSEEGDNSERIFVIHTANIVEKEGVKIVVCDGVERTLTEIQTALALQGLSIVVPRESTTPDTDTTNNDLMESMFEFSIQLPEGISAEEAMKRIISSSVSQEAASQAAAIAANCISQSAGNQTRIKFNLPNLGDGYVSLAGRKVSIGDLYGVFADLNYQSL